jgi:hypothetical protein
MRIQFQRDQFIGHPLPAEAAFQNERRAGLEPGQFLAKPLAIGVLQTLAEEHLVLGIACRQSAEEAVVIQAHV